MARQGALGWDRRGSRGRARIGQDRHGRAWKGSLGMRISPNKRELEMKTKRLIKDFPVAVLVEDFDIYPRHDVDSSHVADLVRALSAGDELPLPIVEASTHRIVDGFHRIRAWRRTYGDDSTIKVEERRYKERADLVRDAIGANAAHGRKLDSQDRTRCALMMEKNGIPVEEIAITLHTTKDRIEQLMVRVVVVDNEKLPAKPIAWPKNGEPRRLTSGQYETMKSSSGWNTKQTVTQLTKEVLGGVVNLKDETLVEALWGLHDAIAKKLKR